MRDLSVALFYAGAMAKLSTMIDPSSIVARKDARLYPNDVGLTSDDTLKYRDIGTLVIGEVAGRDSVASIIKIVDGGVRDVLPTVVYTGTEFGDWGHLDEALDLLERALESRGARLYKPLLIGDPRLWAALAGRFSGALTRRYGAQHFCTACHLYLHICRAPIALAVGAVSVVSGERESHQGRVKQNQRSEALDAYSEVLASAGLKLEYPIRHIEDNSEIELMVGDDWPEGERQLSCVLSGNYIGVDGSTIGDNNLYKRYLEEFLIPAGKILVDRVLNGDDDYEAAVCDLLEKP